MTNTFFKKLFPINNKVKALRLHFELLLTEVDSLIESGYFSIRLIKDAKKVRKSG